jgi:hypothetical protein
MNSINWKIPDEVLPASIAVMRPHGASGNEGLALWFAVQEGANVMFTHVVAPYGPGFRTTPLFMSLSFRAMSVLTEFADANGVFLAGQIHSHPGNFIDLSELDEAHGIRVPDYLSVVCPYYAQRDIRSFNDCGVHYFDVDHYRRLPQHEIASRISTSYRPIQKVSVKVPA